MMGSAIFATRSQLKHDVRALSEAKKSPWGISVGEVAFKETSAMPSGTLVLPLHRIKG